MTRSCVSCGEVLPMEAATVDQLSELGYLHTDVHVDCSECGERHAFGIPHGGETDDPPECPVCGGRWYPYKIDLHDGAEPIDVHWKCEDCYYFQNRDAEFLTYEVYSLGVAHLEGRRDDADR